MIVIPKNEINFDILSSFASLNDNMIIQSVSTLLCLHYVNLTETTQNHINISIKGVYYLLKRFSESKRVSWNLFENSQCKLSLWILKYSELEATNRTLSAT